MIPQSRREVNRLCYLLRKYGIDSGARILDFSCGIGRHSIEFAKRNYSVVGYDPSAFYIEYAKKWSQRKEVRIDFVSGHPLRLAYFLSRKGKFDGIMIMGALGFLDEHFDVSILKNIAKVAKEKSVLVMEIEDRDWTLKNFQECTCFKSKEIEIHETWRFNLETSTSESVSKFFHIANEKGKLSLELQLRTTLRLYSVHEVIRMLKQAGWAYEDSFESQLQFRTSKTTRKPSIPGYYRDR